MRNLFRIGFAPALTIALLIAYSMFQQHTELAAAQNSALSTTQPSARSVVSVLSIVEAKDLLGQTVTVRGKIVSEPAKAPDGRVRLVLQDDTGTLAIDVHGAMQAKRGDTVQVTGKIGGSHEAALLTANSSDMFPVR
jgi:DNA/RNA endonuclease YhcR with UshA esterase domain